MSVAASSGVRVSRGWCGSACVRHRGNPAATRPCNKEACTWISPDVAMPRSGEGPGRFLDARVGGSVV